MHVARRDPLFRSEMLGVIAVASFASNDDEAATNVSGKELLLPE